MSRVYLAVLFGDNSSRKAINVPEYTQNYTNPATHPTTHPNTQIHTRTYAFSRAHIHVLSRTPTHARTRTHALFHPPHTTNNALVRPIFKNMNGSQIHTTKCPASLILLTGPRCNDTVETTILNAVNFHYPLVAIDNNESFYGANILRIRAQWRNKTSEFSFLVVNSGAQVVSSWTSALRNLGG